MPILALTFESLLALAAFLLFSAFSSWVQRKQGGKGKGGRSLQPGPRPPRRTMSSPTSPPETSRPGRRLDWQEELRRLLEGEFEAPPRPAPPPPEPERPAPPPVITAQPSTRPLSPRPSPMVSPVPSSTMRPVGAPESEYFPALEGLPPVVPVTLRESAQAYEQAQALQQQTEATLQRVAALTRGLKERKRVSPAERPAPQAIELNHRLRDPNAVRLAVLASVVLGRPKALEEDPLALPWNG